jgi:hypothetical protein
MYAYAGAAPAPAASGARPPGGAAAAAPAVAPRQPAVVRAKTEAEKKADLIRELTPVLQGELQELLVAARNDVDAGDEESERLEKRGKIAAEVISELKRYEAAVIAANAQLRAQVAVTQAWLEAQERVKVVGGAESLTLSTGAGISGLMRRGASIGSASVGDSPAGVDSDSADAAAASRVVVSVEDVVVPSSVLQSQLLDCVAEDSATEDLYYALDAAVGKGAFLFRLLCFGTSVYCSAGSIACDLGFGSQVALTLKLPSRNSASLVSSSALLLVPSKR